MNEAQGRSASTIRFEMVYGVSKSIRLSRSPKHCGPINQDQVKAIMADSIGGDAAINRLNYDANTSARHKVPVTCLRHRPRVNLSVRELTPFSIFSISSHPGVPPFKIAGFSISHAASQRQLISPVMLNAIGPPE
jgi:hypothetical protein